MKLMNIRHSFLSVGKYCVADCPLYDVSSSRLV